MGSSDWVLKEGNLPIGVDDYKDLIDEGYIYIDKTLLIKEFLENKSKVTLVTRPRRFGKSIALSMLRYFFEKTDKSTAYLFKNSKIWKEKGFEKLQGTYPVIFISFKDIKAMNWERAYQEIKNALLEELDRIITPIAHLLDLYQKQQYTKLFEQTANDAEWSSSLKLATNILEKHYGKKTIILIDEYDSPITHAFMYKFYDEMIAFMRQLLSKALKGNIHLHRGFMTGVVRTAKDGIMSGLNNPVVYTMLDAGYSDKFGFTQDEVEGLLFQSGRLDKKEEIKAWYNGYVIGAEYLSDPATAQHSVRVYNPWSILSYLKGAISPKPYWVNTGSTGILERLIAEAGDGTQKDLKLLVEGNVLENKQIDQDVILLDLDKKHIEPWSFLFFAGYLTATKHTFQNNEHSYTLTIPNEEIAGLYKELVMNVINKIFSSDKLKSLLSALVAGDIQGVNLFLGDFINSMCSFHDLPQNDLERSLHMFVLGLLASTSDRYIVKSNLESGHGRYDILLIPKKNDKAIVIEFKKGKNTQGLHSLSNEALEQIKDKNYISQLRDFGYTGKVFCYGIAIFKKHLVAKMELL